MRQQRLFLAVFAGSALLLAVAYGAFNRLVDPFCHWRDEAKAWDGRTSAYTLNRSLFKLARLHRAVASGELSTGAPVHVLIGDSTSNQIDEALLSELTGETWINLSYGGATLAENVALAQHVLGLLNVRRIVWTLPQRRFAGGGKNEVERSIWMVEHPLAHAMTLESGLAAFHTLREGLGGAPLADPVLRLERQGFTRYFVALAMSEMASWRPPQREVAAIGALEAEARRRGIRIDYAMMPMAPELRDAYRTTPSEQRARWLAFLAGRCVLDLSAAGSLWPEDPFADPLHLRPEHKPRLASIVAGRLRGPCVLGPPVDPPLGEPIPTAMDSARPG